VLTGEAAMAVGQLEKMRTADPNNSAVLYFLGIAYLKQDERAKARQTLDALLSAVSPAQAHYLLGKAYYESELYDDAVAALEKARDLDPTQPDIQLELGKTYISTRDAVKAEAALRETLEHRPADPEGTYFLGALLAQDGRLEEGMRYLEVARSARPEFWGVYYYLGKAHLQQGDAKSATEMLRVAADRNPSESAVFYQLGRALHVLGREQEARNANARVAQLKDRQLNRAREALVSK
jgi:cytochrome c-type biogenesis protein CcmH/NrfG